jgi:hypothetical protein
MRGDPEELAHGSVVGKEDRKAMEKMAQAIACIEHDGSWEEAKGGRETA